VVHPKKIKLIVESKYKNDTIDSMKFAERLSSYTGIHEKRTIPWEILKKADGNLTGTVTTPALLQSNLHSSHVYE